MKSQQFTLTYWKIRGTTQVIRNLLQYLQLSYEDHAVQWPCEVQYSLKIMLEYPRMPLLKHNGFQVTEIVPIAKYICRQSKNYDLLGKNIEDEARIEVVINKIFKARKVYLQIIGCLEKETSDDVIFQKLMLQRIKGLQSTFLKQLQDVLSQKHWYMGYLSLADFFLYNFLFYIQGFVPSIILDGVLDKFMKRFEEIEQIDRYFRSERCCHPPTLSVEVNQKWIGKRSYQ